MRAEDAEHKEIICDDEPDRIRTIIVEAIVDYRTSKIAQAYNLSVLVSSRVGARGNASLGAAEEARMILDALEREGFAIGEFK